MANNPANQLAFDFGVAPAKSSDAPTASREPLSSLSAVAPRQADDDSRNARPVRGRAAMRARTAVLFSRLQEMGLRNVDRLVLMRTRTVMVSLSGRTLRVNEGYSDAPESVLRAVIQFAVARTRVARASARETILSYEVERPGFVKRVEVARPGDEGILFRLRDAHGQLNTERFDGQLRPIGIRLSSRMATRLGHYDPGSRHTPSEIVLSRRHVTRDGWREAMHTLLHEMVHQWQHESGFPVDHGAGFRARCIQIGITPAARRDVTPLVSRRSRRA